MKFESFEAHREVPKTGYLVVSPRMRLQIKRSVPIETVRAHMHLLGRYTTAKEWCVLCVWSHCYYLTYKTHVPTRQAATGTAFRSVINCTTGRQEML